MFRGWRPDRDAASPFGVRMSQNSPLFRAESLEARRQSWLGRPAVLNTISTATFAWFSVAIVVAALLFLVFGEYTRRIRVSGVILPIDGLTRMVAPQAGWIAELKVREGARVRQGDVLYRVSIDSTTTLGNTQDAITKVLRDGLEELRAAFSRQKALDAIEKQSLVTQKHDLEREIVQLEEQIRLGEEFTRQMAEFAERQQQLISKGISVSREYEARLQSLNSQRAQLAGLRRELVQLSSRFNQVENQLYGFDLTAEARKAEIRRQILAAEQSLSEGEAKRELLITAPRDGKVTGIITLAGQTVGAGTPLLTIVPEDRPLVAQLLAPSSAIGFIREGTEVLLRYEAFPYQKFGQHSGRISLISRANLSPEEVAQFSLGKFNLQTAPTLYRITVQPDNARVMAYGRAEPLQAGMQLEAHLLLETRPLYQWILEPLYSLGGSFVTKREE